MRCRKGHSYDKSNEKTTGLMRTYKPPSRGCHGRVKPTGFRYRYGVILIGTPDAYASIISPAPITRPTWPGEVRVPSTPAKNTRSPGCTWLGLTRGPKAHSCCEVRGTSMPAVR